MPHRGRKAEVQRSRHGGSQRLRKDVPRNQGDSNSSLVTEELVSLRHKAALNDTASDRLADVVSGRDRNREELPLDFGVIAKLGMPVPPHQRHSGCGDAVSRTWEAVPGGPRRHPLKAPTA